MERTYTIPLRKAFLKTPVYLRTNRAVREIKIYLKRHMKTEDVKLGEELNKALWARGDSKPPHHVTITVKTEENVAYAELAGTEFKKKSFAEVEEKPKQETRGVDEAALKEAAGKTSVMAEDAAEVIGKAAVAKNKEETAEKKPAKKTAKKAAKK